MKISCIIPTCDRNELLIETISSVLAQTRLPDEILIINNGKRDISLPDTIKNKVKVWNIMPYAGSVQARNFGASLARGDFFAFLDDDDLWSKEYLSKVLEAINKGGKCIVSRLDKLEGSGVSTYKNCKDNVSINNFLVNNPGITGSNVVIAKDLYFSVGGFDPKLPPAEDKGLVIDLLKKGNVITVLPNNQVIIRQHRGEHLSGSKRMPEGTFQFIRKYRDLMSYEAYFYNLKKMYYYRTLNKDRVYLAFLIISLLLFIVKKFKKLFRIND